MSNDNPIILLVGGSGSGKDTIGNIIADNYNAICIGQADPMKRFAKQVFEFSDKQLWGSSEERNVKVAFDADTCWSNLNLYGSEWIRNLFEDVGKSELHRNALRELDWWFSRYVLAKNAAEQQFICARYVLMTLGTECLRSLVQDVWVDYALNSAKKLLGGGFTYDRTTGLVPDKGKGGYDYVVITDGRFRNEVVSVNLMGGISVKIVRDLDCTNKAQEAGIVGHASEVEQNSIPRHFLGYEILNVSTLKKLEEKTHIFMYDRFKDGRCIDSAKNAASSKYNLVS